MYSKEEVSRIKEMWPNTGIHPNDLDEEGNLKPPGKPLKFKGSNLTLPLILTAVAAAIAYVLYNV